MDVECRLFHLDKVQKWGQKWLEGIRKPKYSNTICQRLQIWAENDSYIKEYQRNEKVQNNFVTCSYTNTLWNKCIDCSSIWRNQYGASKRTSSSKETWKTIFLECYPKKHLHSKRVFNWLKNSRKLQLRQFFLSENVLSEKNLQTDYTFFTFGAIFENTIFPNSAKTTTNFLKITKISSGVELLADFGETWRPNLQFLASRRSANSIVRLENFRK